MKPLTRAKFNADAAKMFKKKFIQAIFMKNNCYYWMNAEGLVIKVSFGQHAALVENLFKKFGYPSLTHDDNDDEDNWVEFAYSRGWIRIGIADWQLEAYSFRKPTKNHNRALADWCALSPRRGIIR